jgi:hypothetical protein
VLVLALVLALLLAPVLVLVLRLGGQEHILKHTINILYVNTLSNIVNNHNQQSTKQLFKLIKLDGRKSPNTQLNNHRTACGHASSCSYFLIWLEPGLSTLHHRIFGIIGTNSAQQWRQEPP